MTVIKEVMMHDDIPLKAIVFGCSLRPSPSESSADLLASQVLDEMKQYGVTGTIIRAVDYNIMPGVQTDMGEGDEWPQLRQQMLDADIVIVATPTWVGHMSSVAQRIIERLDAELSEMDDEGRLLTYGKVAAAVVVGNEDGAHKISADLFQSLNDVGFSLAAAAVTYWNGHAMGKVDYKDLRETPKEVAVATKGLAVNTTHLARFLKQFQYPAVQQ